MVTQFIITAEEAVAIAKWQQKHERKCGMSTIAIGGRYTYYFTPTGVGVLAGVKCVCGKKKCFTDCDKM